jgi:hypothetical protein
MVITQTGGAQVAELTPPSVTKSTTPPMAVTIQNEDQTVELRPV